MGCTKASPAVACSFVFTNNGKEDLYLLKRETPIEGLFSPFIDVSLHNSEPIPYQGIIAYRLPPTKNDFVLLKVGESISATVEITDVFNIDTDGLYIIRYSKPLQYLTVDDMILQSMDELKELTVHKSVYVFLEDTQLLVKPKEPEEPKLGHTVHVQDCASANFVVDTKEKIMDTLNAHKRLCSQVEVAKGRVGPNDALYKKWFGAYTSDRAKEVTETYERIKTGLTGRTVSYVDDFNSWLCVSCGAVAYTKRVYPPQPYTVVYFCKIYYDYPVYCDGDKFNKELVLLHEWSHAFGYKDDIKYGSKLCQDLAKNDPDKAVTNSDSYAFHYCESY